MKAASRGVDGKTCFDVSHHQSFDVGVDGWWLVAGLKKGARLPTAPNLINPLPGERVVASWLLSTRALHHVVVILH
jgi:hypothetical protein